MTGLFQVLSRITVQTDIGLTLLVILIGVICLAILAYLFWYVRRWVSARTWVRTRGRIVKLKELIDRQGPAAPRLEIEYEFTIGTKTAMGHRTGLGYLRDRPTPELLAKIRERAADDAHIDVFVDPRNPDRSSLSVSFDGGEVAFLITIFTCGALAVALFLFIA